MLRTVAEFNDYEIGSVAWWREAAFALRLIEDSLREAVVEAYNTADEMLYQHKATRMPYPKFLNALDRFIELSNEPEVRQLVKDLKEYSRDSIVMEEEGE